MTVFSRKQLFCLMMLLEIGSTTLFALGIKAKQDAWLVILIALIPGFIMLWIYTELQKAFPDKNLAEIIIVLLGRFFGIPLIILYSVYYLFLSIQVFTEFGELILLTILPRTPRMVLLTIIMFTAVYVLFLGLNVFARTSEIFLPLVILFIFLSYGLVILSGEAHFNKLLPILENGVNSDFLFEIFHVTTFPYGDAITLFMFWPYVEPKSSVRKISFIVEGLSGLILSISLVIIISALGTNYAASASVPLLEVIRVINIENIIMNIDAIGIAVLFIGGFYKASIYLHSGVLSISTMLKKVNIKIVTIFCAASVLVYGNILIRSFSFHRWIGIEIITKYMHPPFQFFIPVLLLIIYFIKKWKNKNVINLNLVKR